MVYLEDRKSCFMENTELSEDFSLDYEFYIENSRLALEKLVRETRGENYFSNLLLNAFKKIPGKKKIDLI
jgi:hypothetical protein